VCARWRVSRRRRRASVLDCTLQYIGTRVVSPLGTRAWIDGSARRREDILPAPLAVRVRILAIEGKRQGNATVALCKIAFMEEAHATEMCLCRLDQRSRQHRDAIFLSLAVANRDFGTIEVEVFDAQTQAFEQSEGRRRKWERPSTTRCLRVGPAHA
jgi:hypothetical protein